MNGGHVRVLVAGLVIVVSLSLMTMGANGLAEDEIGTRGMQPSLKSGIPGHPGALAQANAQLPVFPQKFDVQGPESDSFGFAVTQPGPVVVDVQAQGTPVIVTLQSLGGPHFVQQGSGHLRLTYAVNQQDVQRSVLWTVQIRLAQGQGGHAGGTVFVQHPLVDQNQALAAARAKASASPLSNPAQFQAQVDRDLQARLSRRDQERRVRQAQELAELQRAVGEIGTRAIDRGSQILLDKPPTRPSVVPAPVPSVPPVIASLSRSQGAPGDSLLINGSGFLTAGGEVHFKIGPAADVVASGAPWLDTQIVVTVPDATGLLPYDGMLYVVRGGTTSNVVPFRFIPAEEHRVIHTTTDQLIAGPFYLPVTGPVSGLRSNFLPEGWIGHSTSGFWGFKGNDQLFLNARLKNGWQVEQAYINAPQTSGGAGAYVVENRIGTDSPYLNVRWWIDAFADVHYSYAVEIRGPKGVPDGLVVP